MEHLDQQIGRVLTQLDTSGLADNTLVLFTSDHGPNPTAESRYGTAAPYRGTKYQVWDGSTHVPAIIRWPGKGAPGSTITETIGSIDLLQTLASIAGATGHLPKERPLDGADFAPLLTGTGAYTRSTPLQWHYYKSSASLLASGSPQAAMRVGDFVIATDPHQDTDIYDPDTPAHTALRDRLIASHQSLRARAPGWGFRSDAPDYSSYAAWRNSHWSGPDATDDAISGRDADPDSDGCGNLREYAMASDPKIRDSPLCGYVTGVEEFDIGGTTASYLTFSFNAAKSGAAKFEENHSGDLSEGDPDPGRFVLTNRLRNPDGTCRIFYRSTRPVGADGTDREFIRLNVSE